MGFIIIYNDFEYMNNTPSPLSMGGIFGDNNFQTIYYIFI